MGGVRTVRTLVPCFSIIGHNFRRPGTSIITPWSADSVEYTRLVTVVSPFRATFRPRPAGPPDAHASCTSAAPLFPRPAVHLLLMMHGSMLYQNYSIVYYTHSLLQYTYMGMCVLLSVHAMDVPRPASKFYPTDQQRSFFLNIVRAPV